MNHNPLVLKNEVQFHFFWTSFLKISLHSLKRRNRLWLQALIFTAPSIIQGSERRWLSCSAWDAWIIHALHKHAFLSRRLQHVLVNICKLYSCIQFLNTLFVLWMLLSILSGYIQNPVSYITIHIVTEVISTTDSIKRVISKFDLW